MKKICNIEVGEKVTVRGEIRIVTSIGTNLNQESFVLWEAGSHNKGGCIPSLWQVWKNGKPSK